MEGNHTTTGGGQAKALYIVSAPAGARWPVLSNNYTVNLVLYYGREEILHISLYTRQYVDWCIQLLWRRRGSPCGALTMHNTFA